MTEQFSLRAKQAVVYFCKDYDLRVTVDDVVVEHQTSINSESVAWLSVPYLEGTYYRVKTITADDHFDYQLDVFQHYKQLKVTDDVFAKTVLANIEAFKEH